MTPSAGNDGRAKTVQGPSETAHPLHCRPLQTAE